MLTYWRFGKCFRFFQVTVCIDVSDAEEFSEIYSKRLASLPYNSPGQVFVAFEKPERVPAVGNFLNLLRFTVKEVNIMVFHLYNLLPVLDINNNVMCSPITVVCSVLYHMDLIWNFLSMAYDLSHLETLSTVWNFSITFGSKEVLGNIF